MDYDIETGYSFNESDRHRKKMIENELGLTCEIINHRTLLVTDGEKKIQLYPTRYFVQTKPQRRGCIGNNNVIDFLKKEFEL